MLDEQTKAKIEKAITESLPAQVGEVLRKQLERIPQLEKESEILKKLVIGLEKNVDRLKTEKEELVSQLSKHQDLNLREKAISERERNSQIEELKFQLSAEKEKTDFTKSVALGLVRNIEYRKSIYDNENGPIGLDQYGNQKYGQTTKNLTESNSAE